MIENNESVCLLIFLSTLEYSVSHSTQTAPYTHARQNRLLFAKRQRQRGIFRLHVGCANTHWTSGSFSPDAQGLGLEEWHTTTKSEMTAGAGNQTWISLSQASTLPDSLK
mgnify:CR=1 FL=1